MQLVDAYSSTSKKIKPLMTIYPMANGDPLLHAYTRLNRKRSTCKFCPRYGKNAERKHFQVVLNVKKNTFVL